MINFYHHLLLAISATLAPPLPHASLKDKPNHLKWDPFQEVALCNTKNALSATDALTFPGSLAPLILSTNANNITIKPVLEQVVNGFPCPLAFFIRKLSMAESGSSNLDREFCHFLEGTPFIFRRDHMPLVHSFTGQFDARAARQRG
ncbi:uncharacterized protein [Palaemon carinicauda]|uniref:uncharacterized protein n=1 Tax=Palaemon carinicauda TaxID=392227 RepID=UPI0035B62C64